MSKRGLSREEKRTKMLELFHETSEFFTLKELEKLGPKQKGIVQQSVKEILDELVSDGLVMFDKMVPSGTSNYFWAFPSAAGASKQAALDKMTKEAGVVQDKINQTRTSLTHTQQGREDTDERQNLLAALAQAQAQSQDLKAQLAACGAADPMMYERKREAVDVAKQAALRWTDNTMILISFLKSVNPGVEDGAIWDALGIGEGWDDLDIAT